MFGLERIGKYEVLGHLASGGMGQVYLARTTGLGGFARRVVVKTLETNDHDEDALVAMFLDEARVLGALHHQYIAPIYEVGRDESGRYFLVMDYIHGETVEAVWKASSERGTSIPLSFSLTVASAISSALGYVHALCDEDGAPLSIIHRDVSLSNVMVGHDGAVKLIDFGIAKAAVRSAITQVGALKGKIGYLAPEQILHRPVDHRADIFALGVVLYELTTMTRAFRGESDLVTLERILRGEIQPPSRVVPGYPPALEAVVMQALAVDPAERFADAAAMGNALEEVGRSQGLALGHACIAEVMGSLFEAGGRRRFPRASSGADPAKVAPEEELDEPTDPIAIPPELEVTTEPRPAIPDETTDVHDVPPLEVDGRFTVIEPPVDAVVAAPAPMVVRITRSSSSPPEGPRPAWLSAAAALRHPWPPQHPRARGWLIAGAAIVVLAIAALVLALR